MKNIIYTIFLLLSITSYAQNSLIYEAEKAICSDSIMINEDQTASNDQYARINKKGYIKWIIDNPFAGWYKISFRYKSTGSFKSKKVEVNGKRYGLGFTMCNNWNNAYFKTYLNKGKNEISLTPDYGEVYIDYLEIPQDSLYILPSLCPVRGVLYKNHPTSLSVFVNAGGKNLRSIYSDNKQIDFKKDEYLYTEGAYHISLSKESLLSLPIGYNVLVFEFENGLSARFSLEVIENVPNTGLVMVLFNVEHGNSVLAFLPNGKKALFDSGKEEYARSVVMPFLDSRGIGSIDYYFNTHNHDDHNGAKDEIIKKYNVSHFYDNTSFKIGDTMKWGDVIIRFLNVFAKDLEENDRSLSFLLRWNQFTYSHGADNYAHTQNRILKRFGDTLSANVFYGNHHFHGSVNPNFIIQTNPELVVVSAEQSVYARGAFTDVYKEQTEKYLYASHARLIETLLTLEIGTVVIRVDESGKWFYETYRDNSDIFIPGK